MCVLCYFFNIILHTFPNIFIFITEHMAFYRFTLNLSLEVAEDCFSQGCFPRRVFKNWNYRWKDVSEYLQETPQLTDKYQFWVCTPPTLSYHHNDLRNITELEKDGRKAKWAKATSNPLVETMKWKSQLLNDFVLEQYIFLPDQCDMGKS